MQPDNYNLGLPAWAFPGWNGQYFTANPTPLASYASVFNTVEGNTTFYHIPDAPTVEKWRQSLEATGCSICFKLPRTITHQKTPDYQDLALFLDRITPLAATNNLGPFLLQFPATVGPSDLSYIESIVKQLPAEYRCALEVRHPAFFSHPELLELLLEKYQLGRVCMDTRPVFHGNRHHPEVLAALHDKPDLPVLSTAYNALVFVRLLLHPDLLANNRYIELWARRIAQALAANSACYMMIHCPNNQHCPTLAREFHEQLLTHDTNDQLRPLSPWPVPTQHQLL